ncbi:VF530 family DNA-binding protein [Psychromonas aquimarina]|uniref:VF530 family DNA-binding protein n=1 Tax=Psychromonas aquimarina TaxID=444919 RepID=UPI0004227966|nr:VF530 family DNA-binding protein [Psychromonas aquimarina]
MLEEQQNNPLHGLKLEVLLKELVEFYGWDILAAAMRFHCFKTNPSIEGSLKFLRKTEWARVKLEGFYLSRFKRMPRPSDEEFALPPRERSFPLHIVPREPMVLTVESIELSQAKAASAHKERTSQRHSPRNNRDFKPAQKRKSRSTKSDDPSDPWGLKNR